MKQVHVQTAPGCTAPTAFVGGEGLSWTLDPSGALIVASDAFAVGYPGGQWLAVSEYLLTPEGESQ